MATTTDVDIDAVLDAETIAVVGCSATPGKAAHNIPKYMLEHGYTIIPVNPNADEVFGIEAYDSLDEVTEEIDVVDVFRPADEAPGIVDQVLARDDVDTVWLQLGIRHDEAGERVRASGRTFVQDRCLKVEHQKYRG